MSALYVAERDIDALQRSHNTGRQSFIGYRYPNPEQDVDGGSIANVKYSPTSKEQGGKPGDKQRSLSTPSTSVAGSEGGQAPRTPGR